MDLESKVQYIKGIGPKKAFAFERLGVKTLADLMLFFPYQYQDRNLILPLNQCLRMKSDESFCTLVKIGKTYQKRSNNNLYMFEVEVSDHTAKTYLRFFRKKNPYANFDPFSALKKDFEFGKFVYVCAKNTRSFGFNFVTPQDYEIVDDLARPPRNFKMILPIYAATETLSQKDIRESIKYVLQNCVQDYPDISDIIAQTPMFENLKACEAIHNLHFPQSLQEAETARRAFAAQEFIILQTALSLSRQKIKLSQKDQKYEIKKTLLTPFKNNLSFEFTNAQKKCIREIFEDMRRSCPTNRLLMGDVGSGKTVVALSAILLAIENGYQTMFVAPTEILAQQHFENIKALTAGLDVKIALITSSELMRKKVREKILADLENGEIDIAVGTHSLLEDRVKFKNLSFVVVDEQHRFGVIQKLQALRKSNNPDILMMTATPIPRALALSVYGEMDMSTIDALPKGRAPIKTFYSQEHRAYSFAIDEIKKGGQVYIVYPLIDESDKVQLKSATESAQKLSLSYFKDFSVGLLHGRMPASQKAEVMEKFKAKEFDVLISTSVIEVGVDVPNATVMIIENASNFGLSALHQLRGRIGRGTKQAYCFLLGPAKNENAQARLEIITKTNDGFKIAEADLKMRGPGEILGTAQHGFAEFKAGHILKDADIIEFAKDFARNAIEKDPKLQDPQNAKLRDVVVKNFGHKLMLINVG
ncbi:MAG: ATP-dependent DNA helicase RecG [Elusimicrobiota bacterium]|jgi:ATP-dependent DNA helicase RecG|nr:ATP-dependent DNA helicase RecG [Elusimicrobiota bacterium]